MDEATLRFFEELGENIGQLPNHKQVAFLLNFLLKRNLPLLKYYLAVPPVNLEHQPYELRVGKRDRKSVV
jgi:hypothetical protein